MKARFIKEKCPKCGGNLYLDSDYYVEGGLITWYEYEACLQCGFINSMEITPKAAEKVAVTDKAVPAIKHLVTV